MTTCGLWLTPRRLVALVRPADAVAHPRWQFARTDDGRHLLIDAVAHCAAELVIATDQARGERVVDIARGRGVTLWLVPTELVLVARVVAGVHPAPHRMAAVLAQLPALPTLRPLLRRLVAPTDCRQFPLL